jgi:hypothetical protein
MLKYCIDLKIPFFFYFRFRVGGTESRSLPSVCKTLGKGYFTLGKAFTECNTRQRTLGKYFIGKGFFAKYFFRADFAKCRKAIGKENTRQINNRFFKKKQQNIF